jgi:hypothetical protein
MTEGGGSVVGEAGHWGRPGRARRLLRGGAPARAASGHEHQGDDAKPRLDPAKGQTSAPVRFREKNAP